MPREYKEIDVDEYNAVQLQDYNGTFGILALSLAGGENTTYYKKWAYASYYKNGKKITADKPTPVAVRLGDKRTAISILETMLRQLKAEA